MSGEQDLPAQRALEPIELRAWQREVSGVLGLATLVYAAVWAPDRGEGDAPIVTLIAFSALLLLLSITGFVPVRVKFRDTELEMGRLAIELVDQDALKMNLPNLERAVEAEAGDRPIDIARRRRYAEHLEFERMVQRDVVALANAEQFVLESQSPTTRFDLEVGSPEAPAFVEIKLSLPSDADLRGFLAEWADQPTLSHLLLVVRDNIEISDFTVQWILRLLDGTGRRLVITRFDEDALTAQFAFVTGRRESPPFRLQQIAVGPHTFRG